MHARFDRWIRPARRARRGAGFRSLLLATVVTGLLSLGPVVAQETDEVAPNASAGTAEAGKQEKICRFEDVTGSRMRKRICHTQEQWDARERAAQSLVRELDAKPVRDRPMGD